MSPLVSIVAVVGMIASLAIIPLGLPGLWIMLGIVLVGWMVGEVQLGLLVVLAVVVLLAELGEWLAVQRFGQRFGGSGKTFLGALAGGMIGALVGAPVPVAGPIVGAFAGTLVGGIAATWLDTREIGVSVRAGWGALVGRAVAVALKVFAGLLLLLFGGGALLVS